MNSRLPTHRPDNTFTAYWKLFFWVALAAVLLGLATGCSLWPKPVELGQRKVEPVPAKNGKAHEADRQAAEYVARKVSEAADAAHATEAPAVVMEPIADARVVASSLRLSLGPPDAKWDGPSVALADRMDRMEARLNHRIDAYREKTAPLVGKKIEGTGWAQVPYFLWVGGVALLAWLGWHAVRLFGMLYPPVGAGVAGLQAAGRVPVAVVSKGFEQLVKGGEEFKQALKQSGLEADVRDHVLDLFRRHQMQAQDTAVQDVVRSVTK